MSDLIELRFQRALKELEGTFIVSKVGIQKENSLILVSFHNPSIRDFVSHRIASSGELMLSLLNSCVYFEQCESLWQISKANGAGSQSLTPDSLLEVMRRTVTVSSGAYSSHGYTLYGNDRASWVHVSESSLQARCLRVFNMIKGASAQNIRQFSIECLGYLQDEIASGDKDIRSSVDLLRKVEKVLVGPAVKSVSKLLMNARGTDDFHSVAKFISSYPAAVSDELREEINYRFQECCDSVVRYLDGSEPEEIRDQADKLDEIAQTMGVDIYSTLREINELADEMERIREEEEEEDEDEPDSDERTSEETYQNQPGQIIDSESDSYITSFFESLDRHKKE